MSFLGIGKYDSLFKLLDTHFVLFPYIHHLVMVVYTIMGMAISLSLDPDIQYKVKMAKMEPRICGRMPDINNTQQLFTPSARNTFPSWEEYYHKCGG
nr:hypothetical protein [Vibrio hepatarius]